MTQKSLNYLFCRASHTHTRAFRSSWRRRLRDDGTERMMKVHGTKPLRYSERTRTRLQRHVCIRVNSDVSYARRRTGRAHAVTDDDNNDMEETTSAVRVFGHERKSHLGPAAMVCNDSCPILRQILSSRLETDEAYVALMLYTHTSLQLSLSLCLCLSSQAYIGDAVWELALRSRELDSARALTGVRPRVAARARAEYQAAALRALEKSGSLSTEEEYVTRSPHTHTHTPRMRSSGYGTRARVRVCVS